VSLRWRGQRWDLLSLRAGAVLALMVGRIERAEQLFSRMLERAPSNPYALASRTHVRAQAGRHEEALADARALVAAHPQRAASDWFNLAYLLESTNRPEEAEPAFRRALDLDPKLDRAWYGLGLVLIRLHRFDDAVTALKKNTELQPLSPYGWYQLARAQFDRREPEETRKVIRHLKTFEPKVAAQLERETGLAG
jgi:tetratricopeptide (TPR) repeat protein